MCGSKPRPGRGEAAPGGFPSKDTSLGGLGFIGLIGFIGLMGFIGFRVSSSGCLALDCKGSFGS